MEEKRQTVSDRLVAMGYDVRNAGLIPRAGPAHPDHHVIATHGHRRSVRAVGAVMKGTPVLCPQHAYPRKAGSADGNVPMDHPFLLLRATLRILILRSLRIACRGDWDGTDRCLSMRVHVVCHTDYPDLHLIERQVGPFLKRVFGPEQDTAISCVGVPALQSGQLVSLDAEYLMSLSNGA